MKLFHVLVALLNTSSICSAPVDQSTTTPASAPLPAGTNQGNQQQQQPPVGPAQAGSGSGQGIGDNKQAKPNDTAKSDQSKPADANIQANKDSSKDQSTSNTIAAGIPIPYERIQSFFKELGNAKPDQFKKLVDDLLVQTKKTFSDFNNIMLQFNKLEPEKKKLVVLWSGDVANKMAALSSQDPSYYAGQVDNWVGQLHTAFLNKEDKDYGKYLSSYFSQHHDKSIDDVGHDDEHESQDENKPHRFAFFSSLYHSLH